SGVNHRSEKRVASVGGPSSERAKAVSECCISAAIACIVVSRSSRSRRQTEAGFPRNGVAVKASTMYRGSWFIGSLLHTVVGRGECEKRGLLLYSTVSGHQVLQPTSGA